MILLVSAAALPSEAAFHGGKRNYLVYVGTNTGGKSKGIYVFHFDTATGKASPSTLAAKADNPGFVAVHPDHRFLYAVNEVDKFRGKKTGAVSAFAIDPATGKLTLLNQMSTRGPGPCHLSIDKSGRNILVANYSGGSVAVLPIKHDGRLGEATSFIQHTGSSVDKSRQEGPHAHGIYAAPDNHFVLVADLGLDDILIYRFHASKGTLKPNDPPFGKVPSASGPRHLCFSPSGRFVYAVNEMRSSITAFSFDPKLGTLTNLQTVSTLPKNFQGDNTGAEIEMLPSGNFLYASNRGDNSIAVFAVNERGGGITPVDHTSTGGKTPRSFAIDPSGEFLFAANQDSDDIHIFRIDLDTGRLTPTGVVVSTPTPISIAFDEVK